MAVEGLKLTDDQKEWWKTPKSSPHRPNSTRVRQTAQETLTVIEFMTPRLQDLNASCLTSEATMRALSARSFQSFLEGTQRSPGLGNLALQVAKTTLPSLKLTPRKPREVDLTQFRQEALQTFESTRQAARAVEWIDKGIETAVVAVVQVAKAIHDENQTVQVVVARTKKSVRQATDLCHHVYKNSRALQQGAHLARQSLAYTREVYHASGIPKVIWHIRAANEMFAQQLISLGLPPDAVRQYQHDKRTLMLLAMTLGNGKYLKGIEAASGAGALVETTRKVEKTYAASLRLLKHGKDIQLGTEEFIATARKYSKIHIDLGTGDGKFVYHQAKKISETFFIGVDLHPERMRDFSRKMGKKASKGGGVENASFIWSSLSELPPTLTQVADSITVNFPWGSLLKGVALPDPAYLHKISSLSRENGKLQILINYSVFQSPTYAKSLGLPVVDLVYIKEKLLPAYLQCGIRIDSYDFLKTTQNRSSWGQKLTLSGQREVLELKGTIKKPPIDAK